MIIEAIPAWRRDPAPYRRSHSLSGTWPGCHQL